MATLVDGKDVALSRRSVGVVARKRHRVAPGYVLFSVGKMTWLLDDDGRAAHSWTSKRNVFVSYLMENGDLLRDGSDLALAPQFKAGGASGYVERVTWENVLVWSWSATPRFRFLSHHDVEPLKNGNVLLLVWEKKSKGDAIAAGRHPELIPDGEVWNNLVVEIEPCDDGGAKEVWRWDQWAHLCQDYDASKANYVEDVALHPTKFDLNFCPPGGKAFCRGGGLKANEHSSQQCAFDMGTPGKTGERDWLHANSVSHSEALGVVVVSYNVPSEVVVLKYRGDGDILYRLGNPLVARTGDRHAQELFTQHSAVVVDAGDATKLGLLVFNNGRAPDRMWSTVDEFSVDLETRAHTKTKSFGTACGHQNSFYCHHSSGCRRLENGNTMIVQGPQGIIVELDDQGEEVWRYISPAENRGDTGPQAYVKQGAQRGTGRFGIFFADKYTTARVPKLASLRPGTGDRLED